MPEASSAYFNFNNNILSQISPEQIEIMQPYLHRVTLVASQVLYEDKGTIDAVYFLEEGLAVLTANTGDGGTVQVGMLGSEGFAGTGAMFDGEFVSTQRGVMQIGGSAYRLGRAQFQQALADSLPLRELCLRHLQALMMQISQTAACNAAHTLPQRLTRLLLMTHDRVGADELRLTQGDLASMLGVRRAGVSTVVGELQGEGLIQQARGRVSIVNRPGLEARSCRCYDILKAGNHYVRHGKQLVE